MSIRDLTSAYRGLVALIALVQAPAGLAATEVTVVGLFPDKAVVQINGGAVRTLAVGRRTPEGVTLLSVERGAATFEIEGRRRSVKLGQQHAASGASSAPSVTLAPDARGHYVAQGQVNGGAVQFIVDTGATVVSLSSSDAERLGIDYRKGRPAVIRTAGGLAGAWRIRLDSVRVGAIALNDVEALVAENQAMPALLGMSFLNRVDMRREGQTMTLTKRY
ncbi:MAG: TIGR02281 family clan AA aspartic protease [Burkholderiales bacterium]|nr:TIGR02281 family clan AA aspartic protease [Burkholderiales bacterium]